MHVLLTGATGFLGHRTLERLAEDPAVTAVTATGRTLRPERRVIHPKVTYRLGDLRNADFVDELVAGADAIIHTAALSSPWGREQAFVNANVTPQEHLLAAAGRERIQRFVYVSTPSLYFSGRDRHNVKESDSLPEPLVNAYARTKRRAERLLEDSALPFVILRPRALIGRGDTVIMPRLLRAYDTGRLRVIGDGKNRVDLTPVSNVVDAIFLGLTTTTGLNDTYNITNGAPVAVWPLINDLLQKLGRKPLTGRVPVSVALAVAGLLETKSRWTNYAEPVLTRYSVGTLARSFSLDIGKARRQLGYSPRQTTATAIEEFINWYHGYAPA
ncbi:MAG: NAD-dependent epimerase/dehydratase family protein [Bacteroidota bacterium]